MRPISKPILNLKLFGSVTWNKGAFETLDDRIAKLPERISATGDFLEFYSFPIFFGFSEVLDHWYLARMADIIRRMSMPAFFVRKGGSEAKYIAYFCLSRTWKEQYKAAFTQLMDRGQEVEITFWPSDHPFNLRIAVRRADRDEAQWKNMPLPGAVPGLCEMNVHAMDTVGGPNHIGKGVFLKLNKELELGISVCLSSSTEFWFQPCVEATAEWTSQRGHD